MMTFIAEKMTVQMIGVIVSTIITLVGIIGDHRDARTEESKAVVTTAIPAVTCERPCVQEARAVHYGCTDFSGGWCENPHANHCDHGRLFRRRPLRRAFGWMFRWRGCR